MQDTQMKTQSEMHELNILKTKEVMKITTLSRSTLFRLIRNGDFPRPIELTPGRSGFINQEILNWISTRKRVC
ncbi:MAG: AlpA family transcriptional regulator [Pseudomonadales bacterium]|nr:AlpA family transcriptional regulator [Pseudomonadales bacterium]MAQ25255.1 AlpA family transcriptional regulator [Pseudomonadales bacterium]MBI27887.1 AlpA family transcriptional regulator [Pseudomonadales bacterium]|tara:strand:+ start:20089 stop:20307 length:219 start_codon:yes stop_codon:yes gene_type:complete